MNHTPLIVSVAAAVVLGTGAATSAGATPVHPAASAALASRGHATPDPARDRVALGLPADQALRLRSTLTDRSGATYVRYDRTWRGMRVLGGDIVVDLGSDGTIHSAGFNARKDVSVRSVTPRVSLAAAESVGRLRSEAVTKTSTASTVIWAGSGTPRLAYDVLTTGTKPDQTPTRLHAIVDASTGAVITASDEIETGVDNGNSMYSGTVSLSTTLASPDGPYQLQDSRGDKATDLHGSTSGNGVIFTDPDDVWGNGTISSRQTAAVDAEYGAETTYAFYSTVLGRAGIWDNGVGARSRVHYGNSYANAFWDGTQMSYGDGYQNAKPLTELDVAAHEMTHGVTQNTADLDYSGEAGAINEATSDIFGTAVEFYADNPANPANYLIGEKIDINGNGTPLRYMDRPSRDGRSPDCYSSSLGSMDVHLSSGPLNHWFYLVSEGSGAKTVNDLPYDSPTCDGSAVTGVGRDVAEKVWYRTLTTKLTSSSGYADARDGAIASARELYGPDSPQCTAVASAFTAIAVPLGSETCSSIPRSGLTAFTVEPAAGSTLLATVPVQRSGAAVQVSATGSGLTLSFSDTNSWTAVVQSPSDLPLAPGRFPVQRLPGVGQVGLDVSGDGRACGSVTGTIDVLEVGRDPSTSDITSFAASYAISCDGTMPANVGELRWNSSVGFVRFGGVVLSTTASAQRVSVTFPAAASVGSVALGGSSEAFAVTADTCSGKSFAVADSCHLDVVAHPTARGGQYADLSVLTTTGDVIAATGLTVVGQETAEGGYTSLAPVRLLDTRHKIGVSTTTPVRSGGTVALKVTGRGGVPSTGVRAVVLNLTVVSPTASAGYLTAYPAGQPRPATSSINWSTKGWIGANLVTVMVGTGGKVNIVNSSGSTHVVADVVGFYSSAAAPASLTGTYGSYNTVEPTRLVDTRLADGGGPVASGGSLWRVVDYGAADNPHVKALALNITAVSPTASGYLSAWDGDPKNYPTGTSTLNYTKGRIVPNMAIVPVSTWTDPDTHQSYPMFGVANRGAAVNVVIDIVGVFDDNSYDQALRFRAITPTRIVDSRTRSGASPLLGGVAQTVIAPPSITDWNTWALVTNTTAVRPTRSCFLTLWPDQGGPRPTVSNLNPLAGQIVANMTMTSLAEDYGFNIFSNVGRTDLVIDIAGTMELYPSVLQPQRPAPGARPAVAPGHRLTAPTSPFGGRSSVAGTAH